MATKYRRTNTTDISRDETSFNITDDKGRAIGYVIIVQRCTYDVLSDDASYWQTSNPAFIGRTSVTRDGREFGAWTRDVPGDTESEVMAKAITRRDAAQKRYAKKFS